MAPSPYEKELQRLEVELKQLEAEYNMFFSGRLPKPPWETRARVEAIVKQYDRAHIQNTGDRFRFLTLQSRFATFVDLWDRGLRAREEGRTGPFSQMKKQETARRPADRVLHVAAFRDPAQEIDKLADLYESVAQARRAAGDEPVPFHKFADLIKAHVAKLGQSGRAEVAFRVAVKNGKVALTARALKGTTE